VPPLFRRSLSSFPFFNEDGSDPSRRYIFLSEFPILFLSRRCEYVRRMKTPLPLRTFQNLPPPPLQPSRPNRSLLFSDLPWCQGRAMCKFLIHFDLSPEFPRSTFFSFPRFMKREQSANLRVKSLSLIQELPNFPCSCDTHSVNSTLPFTGLGPLSFFLKINNSSRDFFLTMRPN